MLSPPPLPPALGPHVVTSVLQKVMRTIALRNYTPILQRQYLLFIAIHCHFPSEINPEWMASSELRANLVHGHSCETMDKYTHPLSERTMNSLFSNCFLSFLIEVHPATNLVYGHRCKSHKNNCIEITILLLTFVTIRASEAERSIVIVVCEHASLIRSLPIHLFACSIKYK